jgi:hypothetical protein
MLEENWLAVPPNTKAAASLDPTLLLDLEEEKKWIYNVGLMDTN